MLYSFTTKDPAVAIWSGTCIDSISPEGKIWISCSWHQYHGMIQLHNNYSHSTGSMYMAWVSASSCHPFKGEISRDKSNYLTVSYSLRNIEIRVIWFEGVLFLEKYRKTSHMIWRFTNGALWYIDHQLRAEIAPILVILQLSCNYFSHTEYVGLFLYRRGDDVVLLKKKGGGSPPKKVRGPDPLNPLLPRSVLE